VIAINWGTSNFRAYRIDASGVVTAERSSALGATSVPVGGYAEALISEVGDWIAAGERRIVMSGMVGSRQGWKEAPYVRVPAAFDDVAVNVIRIEGHDFDARIVPGLMGADESGVPEVMRGEETEVFGCVDTPRGTRTLCLPGTHTKWVRAANGAIHAFSTSMTGDLFKAVREGTILHVCAQHEPSDAEAFRDGVARARQPGDLGHHLFGVRTLVLTGNLPEASASSYLSGILIGCEVKAMTTSKEPVHLVGDAGLCSYYAAALRAFDVRSTIEPPGAALRGLKRIAERLSW
jgi:2-dehydro-3-deoxygalactonokinase